MPNNKPIPDLKPPHSVQLKKKLPVILNTLVDGRFKVELPVYLPGLMLNIQMLYINNALIQSQGCISHAAKLLGIKRSTLSMQLKRRI